MKTLALLLALMLSLHAAPLHPIARVNSKGLYSLQMTETGEREWVPNFGTGSPGGEFRCYCDYNGSHYNSPTSATVSGSKVSQTYAWGACDVIFTVLPDQTLEISGLVTNTSAQDLPNLDLNLCKIGSPTVAPGNPPTINCRFDPGYWSFNGSSTDIPCWLAFSDAEGWPGTMNAGQVNWGANAYYARGYTLKAGTSVTFRFDLNFVSTADDLATVQVKANQAFAQAYPQTHFVQDLRSIGQIFLVTGTGASGWAADHAKWATNPRGWLGDPTIDIANKPAFKSRMEAFCRQCVTNADTIPGMRGFVVWDVEGEQYPHGSNVFIGHPSLTPKWAPEMDEILSDLVTILEAGGRYEVGFCLRQQQVVDRPANTESPFYLTPWQNPDGPESLADLEHEIDWCLSRLGPRADIYYVDSNEGNEVTVYGELAKRYPEVLIFPESFSIVTRMYSSEPQYQTGRAQPYVRQGVTTQPQFTAVYPHAQSLINLADVPNSPENVTLVTDAMLRGDIEMVRIWWTGGSEYPLLKSATTSAQGRGWPDQLRPKPTPSPTVTPTPTPSPSPTPTVTPSPTPTPSSTPSPTPSPTASVSPSVSPSPAPTPVNFSQWLNQLSNWIQQHPAIPDK